jgi:hypothetical protein
MNISTGSAGKQVYYRKTGGQGAGWKCPPGYWGNLKENYEAHNKDYEGVPAALRIANYSDIEAAEVQPLRR